MLQRMRKAEQNSQAQSGPKHRRKSSDLIDWARFNVPPNTL